MGLSLSNPGGYAEYTGCRPDMIRKILSNVSYDAAVKIIIKP